MLTFFKLSFSFVICDTNVTLELLETIAGCSFSAQFLTSSAGFGITENLEPSISLSIFVSARFLFKPVTLKLALDKNNFSGISPLTLLNLFEFETSVK